jgi:predicted nucleotidyltransferase
MPRKISNGNDRARKMLAQEAARIIVEQGIQDYRIAKNKAAERLGMSERGSLPRNSEIEDAVSEYLKIFGRESHLDLLRLLREAALSAMDLLAAFTPRLVGPVLHGTAAANSAVNLHVFSDSTELVGQTLQDRSVPFRIYERRIKSRRDQAETFSGFRFTHNNSSIEAIVFPVNGMRQAPISPVNGKPMRRADRNTVLELLCELPVPGTDLFD